MAEKSVTINDDYAVLRTSRFYFYYGYEYGREVNIEEVDEDGERVEVWGFFVRRDDRKVVFHRRDSTGGRPDCAERLLEGIGQWINDFSLVGHLVYEKEVQGG